MNIFLIDADNLNSGAWIDEAIRVLEESEGPLPVRRAYGSAENLKSLADVLRVWSVRPFVNLSLTKNTTDIALAVDAMEFACQIPVPKTVIIGSGDADFVPLVVRLRERGIRMVCVSERGKMGREAVSAYDRVILVGQEQETPDPQLLAAPAPKQKTTRKPSAEKTSAKKPAPKAMAAKKSPTRKSESEKSAPKVLDAESIANPIHALDVASILLSAPALTTGQPQPLAAVAKALLDSRLRGKNMTATKLLKKFPLHFALLPPEKPRTVTYIAQQEVD